VTLSTSDPKARVAHVVRRQGVACGLLGSPLYAGLLERVAADVEAGGFSWRALEPFADWSGESAYILRFMGAVQRLALTGNAPDLAPHLTAGGDAAAAWPPLQELLERRGDEVQQLALTRPVQTNEVGRSAALAPAILWLSGGRPLRILELGASAGLNLRWDAYRYEDAWGDPSSPVKLERRYEGRRPPFEPAEVEIVERRGCDARPVDPSTEEGRLTLLSYVWPDQAERVELLRRALELAPTLPAPVDEAPAAEWLEHALAKPAPKGVATVVVHSVFWHYLDQDEQARIRAALDETGRRATRETPFAWLRMDAERELTRVDATRWPGGESRLLARAGYHGRPVRWLA
jgi:hypothetical protein